MPSSAAARRSTTAAARAPGADAGRPADGEHDDHADQLNFYKLSFEGTRRWRALKLWMSWKHLGTPGFGRLIEANDDLAAYLAARCAEADDLEALPASPELSVVCFRHLPPGMTGEALDAHQDRLQAALEASGDGWLTTTRLRGATWLRAGIVNYLSTEADIDRLLDTLRRLADTRSDRLAAAVDPGIGGPRGPHRRGSDRWPSCVSGRIRHSLALSQPPIFWPGQKLAPQSGAR